MKRKIKKLKTGDFEVVYEKPDTSYDLPGRYIVSNKRVGMR